MKHDEELFYRAAKNYAEQDGQRLRTEMMLEEVQNIRSKLPPTAGELLQQRNNKRRILYFKRAAGMAAGFLILAVAGVLLRGIQLTKKSENAPQEYLEEEIAANPNETILPEMAGYDIINLAAVLPSDFSIDRIKEDQGQTIYYLKELLHDNVVLVVEERQESDITAELGAGMAETEVAGIKLYGMAGKDYSVIQFEKDNYVYTMTCQYDYETLLRLSRTIISL